MSLMGLNFGYLSETAGKSNEILNKMQFYYKKITKTHKNPMVCTALTRCDAIVSLIAIGLALCMWRFSQCNGWRWWYFCGVGMAPGPEGR